MGPREKMMILALFLSTVATSVYSKLFARSRDLSHIQMKLGWEWKTVGSCNSLTSLMPVHHPPPTISTQISKRRIWVSSFSAKILQRFAITYRKWAKIFSLGYVPFITYPPLGAHLPPTEWRTGKGKGRSLHWQSPLCRWGCLRTSFLVLI